ncbi:MAG: hypothetical protein KBG28_31560 [Kofleriaceae bacterium]|jgi:hypothetical protein|nr:hypothetical protein [Kofleriaceae bacterium]MBP6840307.1 hypothetical protein [Kofleriaceae bacterium]MBP9208548.1 hypothetical protein [Kofleriaceae bacterium]
MRRLSFAVACTLASLSACAVEGDEGLDPGSTQTVEQHGLNVNPIAPYDYKVGQRLFARTTRNPILVLSAGDKAGTFLAWGTENGEYVRWIARVSITDYGSMMAKIGTEFLEMEGIGASINYGVAGSIIKKPPPPNPPIGYPAAVLNQVADLAAAQLTTVKTFNLTFGP